MASSSCHSLTAPAVAKMFDYPDWSPPRSVIETPEQQRQDSDFSFKMPEEDVETPWCVTGEPIDPEDNFVKDQHAQLLNAAISEWCLQCGYFP